MSAVVTDTHSLLWYLNNSPKLSVDALSACSQAENNGSPIYVPAIVLVEIRYLIEKGRDIFESDFQLILIELNNPISALTFAPLSQQMTENLEQIPRLIVPDMPDRIIAVTALTLGLPLISKDGEIQKLTNVTVIW